MFKQIFLLTCDWLTCTVWPHLVSHPPHFPTLITFQPLTSTQPTPSLSLSLNLFKIHPNSHFNTLTFTLSLSHGLFHSLTFTFSRTHTFSHITLSRFFSHTPKSLTFSHFVTHKFSLLFKWRERIWIVSSHNMTFFFFKLFMLNPHFSR